MVQDYRGGATLASGVSTVVVGPVSLIGYRSKSFTVYNQGALTLSGVAVQINPDPGTPTATDPKWETVSTASSIPTLTAKTIQSTDIAKWFRLIALNNQAASFVVSGYAYASAL